MGVDEENRREHIKDNSIFVPNSKISQQSPKQPLKFTHPGLLQGSQNKQTK